MPFRAAVLRIAIWAGAFLVAVPAASGGTVLYVDRDVAPGGDGLAWATAYRDLQDALTDASTNGDISEIRVAAGTYAPAAPGGERAVTFDLVTGVAVYGGYAGFGEPNPDLRDIDSNASILSGDLDGNDAGTNGREDNSYHVVTVGDSETPAANR